MAKPALPCCPEAEAQHLVDLPHLFQFDFDLYQCRTCGKFWVYAWLYGRGGWEPVSTEDAERMRTLEGLELRTFMRGWAKEFN